MSDDARTASLNKGEIAISGLVKTALPVSIHRFWIFWEQTMCALLRQQGIAKFLPAVYSVRLIMKELIMKDPFKVTEGSLLTCPSPSPVRDIEEQSNSFQHYLAVTPWSWKPDTEGDGAMEDSRDGLTSE